MGKRKRKTIIRRLKSQVRRRNSEITYLQAYNDSLRRDIEKLAVNAMLGITPPAAALPAPPPPSWWQRIKNYFKKGAIDNE